MPSGLRKTTGNHFEIYYEEPWGGVASDKSSVDIAENQCVKMDGVTIKNGLLCYSNMASQNSVWDLELIPPKAVPEYTFIVLPFTYTFVIDTAITLNYGLSSMYAGGILTIPDSSIFIVGQIIQLAGLATPCPNPITDCMRVTVTQIINSTQVRVLSVLATTSNQFSCATPLGGYTGVEYFGSNLSAPQTPYNATLPLLSATPTFLDTDPSSPTYNQYRGLEVLWDFDAGPAYVIGQGVQFTITGCDNPALDGLYTYIGGITVGYVTGSGGDDQPVPALLPNGTAAGTSGTINFLNVDLPIPATPTDYYADAYTSLIFNASNFLCAVDQYGLTYIATLQSDGTIKFQFDQFASGGASLIFGAPSAVKVVNGIAYIAYYTRSELYAYTPTVSYTRVSTYTAGLFIDIFDEYMIQLNCNSAVDGVQPTLVSWSSPDAFGTWDPSVNRTAGFNLLTSVEDFISGFVAVDNVGYIFKRTGVTQMTATGVAIGPWAFTTYWNSTIGQGLVFPYTLKQFGRFTFLATDSDIYAFYGGSFTPIGSPARTAIYSSFNVNPPLGALSNDLVTGGINMYPFNDLDPGTEYVFIAATASVAGNVVFWSYQANEKVWTTITKSISELLSDYVAGANFVQVNFIKTAAVYLNQSSGGAVTTLSNLPVMLVYINFTYTVLEISYTKTFIYYNLVNTPTADVTSITIPPGNLNLVFRAEEIKLGFTRKCTIRRAVVKAYGTGTLAVNITDIAGVVTSLGTIVLDGTNNQRTYYTPYGMATVEAPQLSITSTNFNGAIVKVMLAGTYADGDID